MSHFFDSTSQIQLIYLPLAPNELASVFASFPLLGMIASIFHGFAYDLIFRWHFLFKLFRRKPKEST